MLRAETLKLVTLPATRLAVLIAALGLIATQLTSTVLLPHLVDSGAAGPEVTGELPVIDMGQASAQLAVLIPWEPAVPSGSSSSPSSSSESSPVPVISGSAAWSARH